MRMSPRHLNNKRNQQVGSSNKPIPLKSLHLHFLSKRSQTTRKLLLLKWSKPNPSSGSRKRKRILMILIH